MFLGHRPESWMLEDMFQRQSVSPQEASSDLPSTDHSYYCQCEVKHATPYRRYRAVHGWVHPVICLLLFLQLATMPTALSVESLVTCLSSCSAPAVVSITTPTACVHQSVSLPLSEQGGSVRTANHASCAGSLRT